MKNTAKNETSAIDKTVLLIKATIGKRKSDVYIWKGQVLKWANIRQIAVAARKPMICWDIKKTPNKRKAKNGREGP